MRSAAELPVQLTVAVPCAIGTAVAAAIKEVDLRLFNTISGRLYEPKPRVTSIFAI